LILDSEAAAMLDAASSPQMHGAGYARDNYTVSSSGGATNFGAGLPNGARFGDAGGASRFFFRADYKDGE